MPKKGQAAMEFLMTYGWAILVVIVAIAALAYFGVRNPGRFLPESCNIAPGFSCSFKISPTGIDVNVQNGIGQDLQNFYLNVSNCDEDGPYTFMDGTNQTFSLSCTTGVAGQRYKQDVMIVYSDENGFGRAKVGQIVGKIES